jgi:hypothetical protein
MMISKRVPKWCHMSQIRGEAIVVAQRLCRGVEVEMMA